MSALIIIATVVGYILIGGIVAGIATCFDTEYPKEEDISFGIIVGVLWPASVVLTIVVSVVVLAGTLPYKLGEKIVKNFKKWYRYKKERKNGR